MGWEQSLGKSDLFTCTSGTSDSSLIQHNPRTQKWDKRYLELAKQVASWSKDPSTQVGAVAVGASGQVLSQGYNGFPRGISDNPERLANRNLKYKYIVHAEMNAIYNASFNGVSLAGSTMYVYGLPCCSECTKGLLQVGVTRIVMPKQSVPDSWKESCELSRRMCEEAHVEISYIEDHSYWTESSPSDWEPVKPVTRAAQPVDGPTRSADVLDDKLQSDSGFRNLNRGRPEPTGGDKRLP